MEPAKVYSFSRSKYTSASWSSSTIPTLVSCGVVETNSSFVMLTPDVLPRGKHTSPAPGQRGKDWRYRQLGTENNKAREDYPRTAVLSKLRNRRTYNTLSPGL